MPADTVKIKLTGTFGWGDKRYGPGDAVEVPAKMAEWLGAEPVQEAEKPAKKAPAKGE